MPTASKMLIARLDAVCPARLGQRRNSLSYSAAMPTRREIAPDLCRATSGLFFNFADRQVRIHEVAR